MHNRRVIMKQKKYRIFTHKKLNGHLLIDGDGLLIVLHLGSKQGHLQKALVAGTLVVLALGESVCFYTKIDVLSKK